MKSDEILLEMSHIGKLPRDNREFLPAIVPLTYLGSDRCKVRNVRTNPIHYISSLNILCRDSIIVAQATSSATSVETTVRLAG